MVKERKAQLGCSNLSARSDTGKNGTATVAASAATGDVPAFYRSWTHKLVSPDEYIMKDPKLSNARTIKLTATWQPKDVTERNFDTVHSSSYIHPKDMPVRVRHLHTIKELADNDALRQEQKKSIDELCRVARKMYGTSQAMMKKFNKKNTDEISIDELGKYMNRNKLDTYVTDDDRQKIFDFVDPNHNGSLPVSSLLKTLEEEEFHESEHTKEMMKIRDFLAHHVDNHRDTVEPHPDPDFHEIKKKKDVPNEKHLKKVSLGTKTFDLDVASDELQQVIQGLYEQFPDDESHRKFARFLKVSNLNLSTIPFYDIRHENLDNLKHKAAMIEQLCHDEDRQQKYEDLTLKKMRGSLSQSIIGLPDKTQTMWNTSKYGREPERKMNLSASMPSLSFSTKAVITSSEDNKPSRNLLDTSTRGVDIEPSPSSPSLNTASSVLDNTDSVSTVGSPLKAIRASRLKDDLFSSMNQTSASDFYTQIVESGTSMGRMKDPTKVMRVEKIDPGVYKDTGKRSVSRGPTDWTRVGVGGERAPGEGYGSQEDDNHNFHTTNGSFYTPIIYEPSQPAMRHGKSETELNVEKRNYRRQERAARTQANMQFTKDRLEQEIMEKELRRMRNEHSKVISNIRYETAMFLNDMAKFKQQPLQRMNRKPNLLLSDRMWGGSFDKQTVVQVDESRDFNTTYNVDFQSEVLRSTMNGSTEMKGPANATLHR